MITEIPVSLNCMPSSYIEPSLSRIRQLHRMSAEQIKRGILLEIFEDPSIQARICHVITERMPTHIRDMEREYRMDLRIIRSHPRHVETESVRRRWPGWDKSYNERKVSRCKNAIDECEKKLQELGDFDRMIAKACQSVLKSLYSGGIYLIRESIRVRYAIPQLKEEERMTRKSNRCLITNLKIIDKAQKQQHRVQKQQPQLPMKQHRCRR